MNVQVSIIVPVYNAEKYIRQMIGSILAQSFQNFEIICVDDGSTDQSCAVIEELTAQDGRICLLHKEHSNAGEARNIGMDVAKGTYLMFLDADDFFEPEMLEECVAKLEEEQSDLVIFSANQYNELTGETTWMFWSLQEQYLPDKLPFAPLEMKEYLFNSFQNWPWNKMFRRSYIMDKGIRYQSVPRTNDMAFVCEALARANLISIIKKPFANYRVGTDDNCQATNHLYPKAFWEAYVETKRRLIHLGLYESFRKSYLNWILDGTLYNISANRQEYSRIYARSVVKYEGEREFEFLNQNRKFYHIPEQYDAYRTIVDADMPPELEQIKELNRQFQVENERQLLEIQSLREERKRLSKDVTILRKRLEAAQREASRLENSNSYRLGRTISWPYRMVKQTVPVPQGILRIEKGAYYLRHRYQVRNEKIVIQLRSRLGNQMFLYALYLKLLSMGRNVSIDDISRVRDHQPWYHPDLLRSAFDITYTRATDNEINMLQDVMEHKSDRILHRIFGKHPKILQEVDDYAFDERVFEISSGYLTGWFQNTQYFTGIENKLRRAFQFRPIDGNNQRAYRLKNTILNDQYSISVHLRFGDYLNKSNYYKFGDLCTEEYYSAAIEKVQQQMTADAKMTFYVFSDDPVLAREWISRQEKSVTYRFIFVDVCSQQDSWIDMYLMSLCRHNIIANSTFSWWAAWLNENPNKIVIGPSIWYKNNGKCYEGIHMDNIILIDASGNIVVQRDKTGEALN